MTGHFALMAGVMSAACFLGVEQNPVHREIQHSCVHTVRACVNDNCGMACTLFLYTLKHKFLGHHVQKLALPSSLQCLEELSSIGGYWL